MARRQFIIIIAIILAAVTVSSVVTGLVVLGKLSREKDRFTSADVLKAFEAAGLQVLDTRTVPAKEHFGPASVEAVDFNDYSASPGSTGRIYICNNENEMATVRQSLDQFRVNYFINKNVIMEVAARSRNAGRYQAAFTTMR